MIKNKKGSLMVFLAIFFVAIVSALFTFIEASKQIAIKGSVDAIGDVITQAILAEYDLNLQKKYNLFGFYGLNKDVNRKADFYAKEAFGKKKYIDYKGCQSNLTEYSLAHPQIFKKQIVEAGKFSFAGKNENKNPGETEQEQPQGIIRNRGITDYLPSKGAKAGLSIISLAEKVQENQSIKELVSDGKDRIYLNKYISTFFKTANTDKSIGNTFFQNETEYLICGKYSDRSNLQGTRSRIIGLREMLNFAYLKTDSIKCAEALAAAQAITPGPAATATYQAITAAWALAESVNDYKLLRNNYNVPIWKTEKQWAVDLDSVINNKDNDCIYTGIDKGEGYEDYLNLLLYGIDENVLLLRMMDLIQINMRYLFYEDFLLRDYNAGVKLSLGVNGKTYEVSKEY